MTATLERPPVEPAGPPSPGPLRVPWDRRRIAITGTLVGMVVAAVWAWRAVGMTLGTLISGLGDIANLIGRMLPPKFVDLDRVLDLAFETLLMALLGTLLAVVLSVPISVLAARNTTPHPVAYAGARGLITFSRAVPDLIFALILVRALGIGPLPGILALGLHSVGMIGKLFADAIEQIDEGPREAIRSTGAGRLQELATAVTPQVLPAFVGVGLYRLDINLRVSVILGIVGAGGIGFELQAALRSLLYDQALGVVTIIAAMVIAVEFAAAAIRQSIIGDDVVRIGSSRHTGSGGIGSRLARRLPHRRTAVVDGTAVGAPVAKIDLSDPGPLRPPWTRERITKTAYLLALAGFVMVAFLSIDLSPLELLGALPDVVEISGRLVPPDFTTARDSMIEGMVETVAIGVVATVLGVVLMAPLAFLSARNVAPSSGVYYAARTVLVLLRSIPELIVAIIFVAAMGLGPVPGVFALALGTVGFLAKLMADSLEEIDAGPREAVLATGATRLQEPATSVVPQAMPAFVSNALYALDINIRTSTILGIVGGGGIGFLLFNSIRTLNLQVTGAILVLIFGVVYAIELFSGWLRKQLR